MKERRCTRAEMAKTARKYLKRSRATFVKKEHFRDIARLIIRTGKKVPKVAPEYALPPRKPTEAKNDSEVLLCQG